MTRTIIARFLCTLGTAWVLFGLMLGGSAAQTQAPAATPPPAKLQQLLDLLNDPEVKAWLEQKAASPAETPEETVVEQISGGEAFIRTRLEGLKSAVPRLPAEFANAANIVFTEAGGGRHGVVGGLIVLMIGIGYGAEWLFRRAVFGSASGRREADPATLSERSPSVRILLEATSLGIFAIASAGLFLAFDWPPLLRQMVITFLLAFVAFRILTTLFRFLLAPAQDVAVDHPERLLRIVRIEDAEARFWHKRLTLFAGYFLFGWATVSLMPRIGFSPDVTRLFAYLLGLGLLVLAIEIVWRRPSVQLSRPRVRLWLLTAYLVVLWLIWVAGLIGILWLGIFALILPKAVVGTGKAAQRIADADGRQTMGRTLIDVLIVRGARAVVIALAVGWLAYIWRVSPTANNLPPTAERIVEGLLHGVVVLLVADLVWNFCKAYIARKLEDSGTDSHGTANETARAGRMRTLLPIFRNTLAVFIGVVAVLTILAGLGVQIAPLIAGAGIFGVAIGFGSQTLVKDVLSGVFFMLDDAFRVGAYIQSGSYTGTVASFSLRSVRLRHHRGPIFTVPFGDLGAVQNMSRDWVIDKFLIGVSYDTNISQVKKLVKSIGAELKADPELGPQILETVKMKGVEQFGDYGINLSFGMMTKPGQQSVVRRRAYTMIREAFKANGIEFAQPTVNVGGDEKASAAAAQTVQARKAAEEAATAAAANPE
jgi:small-conductance mechanosensitive channel